MDDFSWFWSSEWQRDKYLRSQLETQAANTSMLLRSQANDARQLRERLGSLEGDLSTRLNALSQAFTAYVELDGLRQQLAGFPDNAQARRLASEDLAELVAGRRPPQRDDIAGYWLVPGVGALRPDGSIDEAAAATAAGRDELTTRRFLLAARAALGRGPELVDELVALMAPLDAGESPGWDAVQVMFWAATLRGAFGPQALERLEAVAGPPLDQLSVDEWRSWARERSYESLAATGQRGDRATDIRPIIWLADQLAAVVEPVEASPEDDSWQLTWRTVDQAGSNQAASSVASQADPETVARSNRELLLGVAEHLIARGAPGEHELLMRAAELRAEIAADPSAPGGLAQANAAAGLPAHATGIADQIRQTAIDPNASAHDRRILWQWIGVRLRDWLANEAATPAPLPALVPVSGHRELQVSAAGPPSPADVEQTRARLQSSYTPSALVSRWPVAMIAALLFGLGGIGLALANLANWWVLLILVGLILGGVGYNARGKYRQALDSSRRANEHLDESLALAQRQAQREDNEASAFHERLTQTARRALAMTPEP